MPKVSIIIATYNRARFLGECLESIVGQAYPDLEVLVIDDGSTDETAQIVTPFCPPVRYLRQENQGEYKAKNRGISLSSGEYIRFVDSDDVMLDGLEEQIALLDAHPRVASSTARHGQSMKEESSWL